MKLLIGVLFSIGIFSCSNKEGEEVVSKKDYVNVSHAELADIKEDKVMLDDFTFDFSLYEKGFGLIVSEIVKKKDIEISMLTDTLRPNQLLFVELKNNALSNITDVARNVVKYTFKLEKEFSGLKHHLVVIQLETTIESDTLYNVIEKIALEKSGVPGLAYANDFVLKSNKTIYWLNSNCAYSFESHNRFIELLKSLLPIDKLDEQLDCECGKVVCVG